MGSSHGEITKSRILVVDDDELYLTMLVHLMEDAGYDAESVNNGSEAIKQAEASLPDLIILDIHMPDMDGYEVCMKIKSNKLLENVPVIFISGLSESFNKVKGFEVGAVDYINKPFTVEEVVSRVNTHINLGNKIKELKKMNSAMIRREMRVIELKEEVNKLAEELGRKPPYSVVWEKEVLDTN